ncbi:hypothetical protein BRADI_1g14863v3 [Brachypodium distachyon]|uniref:Uncharacterized protein n=1 Tax=Brachypodium distachyon TaxID=15368 RepID=A0A0Q3J8Q0_BRADI|nr:hypothetical protein BRADI_1g14863v3 [Brachypodium distachyon]
MLPRFHHSYKCQLVGTSHVEHPFLIWVPGYTIRADSSGGRNLQMFLSIKREENFTDLFLVPAPCGSIRCRLPPRPPHLLHGRFPRQVAPPPLPSPGPHTAADTLRVGTGAPPRTPCGRSPSTTYFGCRPGHAAAATIKQWHIINGKVSSPALFLEDPSHKA